MDVALGEATARWGPSAVVHVEAIATTRGGMRLHSVGRDRPETSSWDCFGQGETWQAAFLDADSRVSSSCDDASGEGQFDD